MFLLLLSLLACHPAAPERVGPPVDPIYFSSGSTLAGDSEATKLEAAAYAMNKDPELEVTLFGYSDPKGSASAIQSASLSRAKAVRDKLVKAGVDSDRIVVKGMGAATAGANGETEKRVELVFSKGAGSAATTAAAGPPAAADNSQSAKDPDDKARAKTAVADTEGKKTKREAKGSDSEDAPEERRSIEPTGLADLDSFFAKVQTLLARLWSIQDNLIAARDALLSIIDTAQGAALADALPAAIAAVKDSVQLTTVGGAPKLKLVVSSDKKAGQVVGAVNKLVDAVLKAAKDLPQVKNDAMIILAEAQTLPARLPSMVTEAGLKPTELPRIGKAVKANIKATATIPKEVDRVIDEGKTTFSAVKAAFSG